MGDDKVTKSSKSTKSNKVIDNLNKIAIVKKKKKNLKLEESIGKITLDSGKSNDEDEITKKKLSKIIKKKKTVNTKSKPLKKKKKVNSIKKEDDSLSSCSDVEDEAALPTKKKKTVKTISKPLKKKKKVNSIKKEDDSLSSCSDVEDEAALPTKKKKTVKTISKPLKKKKKVNSIKKEDDSLSSCSDVEDDAALPIKRQKVVIMQEVDTSSSSSNLSESEEEGTSDDSETKYIKRDGQSHKDVGGFTVIGDVDDEDLKQVCRVLPKWLSCPIEIPADIRQDSLPLNKSATLLDDELVALLRENGIEKLFPVQYELLPYLIPRVPGVPHTRGIHSILPPSDLCCSAPTGSGKTLAFVLPIVQVLKKRVMPCIRALVVLPLQDLASQVAKVFKTYCQNTDLKVVLLVGQKNLIQEQHSLIKHTRDGFENLADIVIATPGRLVDHINNTTGMDLTHLRFLVIDEADRMMDEIKHDWLSTVEKSVFKYSTSSDTSSTFGDPSSTVIELAPTRDPNSICREPLSALTLNNIAKQKIPLQKLLFSATLSINPEKLNDMNLFRPKLFTSIMKVKADDSNANRADYIGKYTTPIGLTENYILCLDGQKPLYMFYLMLHLKFRRILCFTNTVDSAHRLYLLLKLAGLNVAELTSMKHAVSRQQIIKKFEADHIDCIVCSDSVARGIDISNVNYVVAYDCSTHLKTYIHRVGRTARAGRAGTCVSLVESKELHHFNLMSKVAGKHIKKLNAKVGVVKPFMPLLRKSLKQLENVLKGEKIVKSKS